MESKADESTYKRRKYETLGKDTKGNNGAQYHLIEDSDDSDIEEEDVKICDTCGDVGLEELLAICGRCSEGAEHTYCMAVMGHTVSEGNFVCAECKIDESIKYQRKNKLDISLKSEAKVANGVDKTRKKSPDVKILGKRHTRDEVEITSSSSSLANKPVLGSPKKSLSRDDSFKRLQKGKESFTHQSSSNALLTVPEGKNLQGTFLKSKSFSSSNANNKVNLVPPKERSVDIKEKVGRSLGKSMSLKNTSGEPKVKMLSPDFIHNIQDKKGNNFAKERSVLDRKNSFTPSLNSTRVNSTISTSKNDKKLASLGETSLSSIRQSKSTQPESSKSTVFSKSNSLVPPIKASQVVNGSNNIKAAIEAARLRKPDIYRRSRVDDKSIKQSALVSQEQSRKNISVIEPNKEITAVKKSSESYKQKAIEDVKQFKSLYRENSNSRIGYDGKNLSDRVPRAIYNTWKFSVLPEFEFIWQGNFEVRGSVKGEFCKGIQAHLSTCVSPNVVGVANKFPQKLVLNEVARMSTWPIQFYENGVKDYNIGLYFFAKDVDSYVKSYKILLDKMIKHDLALKGNMYGVELLIFPSTQLPEKSKRWNKKFFLWGVFRGNKPRDSQQIPVFPKQFVKKDVPRAHMGPTEKNVSSIIRAGAEDSKHINMERQDSNLQNSRRNEGGADKKKCKEDSLSSLAENASNVGNDSIVAIIKDEKNRALKGSVMISEATSELIIIDDDEDDDDVIILSSDKSGDGNNSSSSKNAERYLFPVDLNHASTTVEPSKVIKDVSAAASASLSLSLSLPFPDKK